METKKSGSVRDIVSYAAGTDARETVGSHFYAWLIKQGFPEGYQTLCMNYQMKKKHNEEEFNNLEHIERRKVYGR